MVIIVSFPQGDRCSLTSGPWHGSMWQQCGFHRTPCGEILERLGMQSLHVDIRFLQHGRSQIPKVIGLF